jgi:flagellar protein FlgJ
MTAASFDSSFDFNNLQGLSSLRTASDTPEARRAVAKQFESLFMNLMIRQMRNAGSAISGGLIDQDRMELHQSMYDQQLALTLAQGRGIGLADSILRSLGGNSTDLRLTQSGRAPQLPQIGHSAEPFAPATPEEFVDSLWPHAERAARKLGVDPQALVAQAALETGWGQSLPADQHGTSSLNLFGIKAGSDWEGPRAVISTLEFVNGVPERRHEPFRMYRSISESFDDYVDMIRSKPRYAEALAAATPAEYFQGLQAAGYATDPDYAGKLNGILNRGLPGRESPLEFAALQNEAPAADNSIDGTRPTARTGGYR